MLANEVTPINFYLNKNIFKTTCFPSLKIFLPLISLTLIICAIHSLLPKNPQPRLSSFSLKPFQFQWLPLSSSSDFSPPGLLSMYLQPVAFSACPRSFNTSAMCLDDEHSDDDRYIYHHIPRAFPRSCYRSLNSPRQFISFNIKP